MSDGDRLTKQELSWLLTQEARAAARTLRKGVAALSQYPPAPEIEVATIPTEVTSSIEAIDDAMRMLASLNTEEKKSRGRGRQDLATILYESAPNARVHLELGSGTEVYADEGQLRRMCQVLVFQGGGTGASPDISVARVGDDVKVSVALGPETGAGSSTESAWLNRMALRYGGRVEFGGTERVLVLPAADLEEKREVKELRQELAAAQQQGEAYARELAAVFASGDLEETKQDTSASTIPPPASVLQSIRALSAAVESQLREPHALLKKAAEVEGRVLPEDVRHALQTCRDNSRELLAALASLASLGEEELPGAVDLATLAQDVIALETAQLARRRIEASVSGPDDAQVIVAPKQLRAIVTFLIEHAIAATPEHGKIALSLRPERFSCEITVDDSGVPIPSGMRNGVVWHRVEASSVGRPKGVHLLGAATLVAQMGGSLRLDDSPLGGVRVVAQIPTT